MTRICLGYESHVCDVSLDGTHSAVKRCPVCGPKHKSIRQRDYRRNQRANENKVDDLCGPSGADALAAKIQAYWAARGHEIDVNTIKAGFNAKMRSTRVDVRSSLVNGRPA